MASPFENTTAQQLVCQDLSGEGGIIAGDGVNGGMGGTGGGGS